MMKPMANWGPDSSGIWVDGPVGLGQLSHRATAGNATQRLGHNCRLAAVADMRLDNRDDLLSSLNCPTSEWSTTDLDILIRAFERWRGGAFARMYGDFAAAVWDNQYRRLYIGTDHYGSRPVYYSMLSDKVLLATTIRSLFAMLRRPSLCDERVADYLLATTTRPGNTFFSGISRLPAGHWASFEASRALAVEYWSPTNVSVSVPTKEEERLRVFRELFRAAVACRVRAHGKVGIRLSGGLDSSSVACVAARELATTGATLHAFSAVPLDCHARPARPRLILDETHLIEELRRRELNLDVSYIRAEGWTPISMLELDFESCSRPLYAARNRYWIRAILVAAREKGIRVLLSGQHGNATISWRAEGYLASLLASGHLGTFWDEMKYRRRQGIDWRSLLAVSLTPLMPNLLWTMWQRVRTGRDPRLLSYISPKFARSMGRIDWTRSGTSEVLRVRPRPDENRRRTMDWTRSEMGEMEPALCAEVGIEPADPTRDRRLVEYCLSLPITEYVAPGQSRMLIRRAMEGTLPPAILWNTSLGVQGSDAALRLSVEVHKMRNDINAMRNSVASRYLDIAGMMQELQRLGTTRQWTRANLDGLLRAYSLGRFCTWYG